ncbi:hypothetical protein K8I31_11885, partial [bacterium]|nr:hypothetical protein [bacterium]
MNPAHFSFSYLLAVGAFTSLVFFFIEIQKRKNDPEYKMNYYFLSFIFSYPIAFYVLGYLDKFQRFLSEKVSTPFH